MARRPAPASSADPKIERAFRAALLRHQAGDPQGAAAGYQAVLALAPDHAPSLHLLGVLAFEAGALEAALHLVEAAIAADPSKPAYHNDRGEILRQSGEIEAAAIAFVQAITLDRRLGSAHNNLGIIRRAQGRLEEALGLFERAMRLMPDHPSPRVNAGATLTELGRLQAALPLLTAAQAADPLDAAAAIALGNLRLRLGDPVAAEALYRTALAIEPDGTEARLNLAEALRDQGRLTEALSLTRAVLVRTPELAVARWNDGLTRLLAGDLAGGWRGFAWRWRAGAVPHHGLDGPEWDGSDLGGATLLVHAEQGLGDTIQMLRFLPGLRARGAGRVLLLCLPALVRLLDGIPGLDAWVDPHAPLPAYDRRIALMDLPRIFGIGLADLPGPIPYLVAPRGGAAAERVAALASEAAGRALVGLVWRGRPTHRNDQNRSLPAALLAPVLARPDLLVISLQQERLAGDPGGLVGLDGLLTDLAETAAVILRLDLVIAVDTAIAHLAGALGRPVWLLLPAAPDWRWMRDRSDSPWYPSARLFRQPQPGAWPAVIAAVMAALDERALDRAD